MREKAVIENSSCPKLRSFGLKIFFRVASFTKGSSLVLTCSR